jgi:hypothetical protein
MYFSESVMDITLKGPYAYTSRSWVRRGLHAGTVTTIN